MASAGDALRRTWRALGRSTRAAPLLAGSLLLLAAPHAAAHPQSALEPKSSGAEEIADLWWFMLIVSTIVVAVVIMLVSIAVLRRRGGIGDRTAGWLGGGWLMPIGALVFPIAILSVLFALTLSTMQGTAPGQADPKLEIEVEGRQWFWDVRYPGTDAITANEIHVPVGVPVEVELTTGDVLHSFWVPSLNRKVDLIPGRQTTVEFEVSEPGTYRGQCAEFCGLQHANMALLVIAHERDEFREWLNREAEPAPQPRSAQARRGQEVFMSEGCQRCHTLRGTEARGNVGPDLTHIDARETLAAVTIGNNKGNLGGWVLDPQHIKPGVLMPGTDLDGDELQALLAYLEGLD